MARNGGTRLELTWIGKNDRPRLEPRILIEDAHLSHHAATKRDGDIFDNMLIQGDNLLALKALEASYTGKIKCVFIDPPYNTGSAFKHYDDGIEHSLWLSLMRDRLEIIRSLLMQDGSLWITIDDNEAHYLKVLCDDIFGRGSFIADITWKRRDGAPNDRKIGSIHDHILVYSRSSGVNSTKTPAEISFNLMQRTEKADSQYQLYEEPFGFDERGPFRKVDSTGNAKGGRYVESLVYPVTNPFTGEQVFPRKGRCWVYKRSEMEEMVADRRFFWGKDGKAGTPMRKLFKSEAKPGMTAPSIWDDVGLNQHAAREIELLFGEKAAFETPKPEALVKRALEIASNPGDLILDSFAGSGTTGAVAHKMRRRWIMVELGEHAVTHIIPRLQKVVDGKDRGGVTESTSWQGGGGFRFYRLAPSLLEKDKWGNWVIAKTYNAAMLAEAMCRHMGFVYAPSQDVAEYWKHGHSSERDFIFITTASLTHDQLKAMSHDVGPDRTLLICCKAFNARPEAFDNLTVQKIPHAILNRCEWGRDDYSLAIAELPPREPAEDSRHGPADEPTPARRGRDKKGQGGPSLFDDVEA